MLSQTRQRRESPNNPHPLALHTISFTVGLRIRQDKRFSRRLIENDVPRRRVSPESALASPRLIAVVAWIWTQPKPSHSSQSTACSLPSSSASASPRITGRHNGRTRELPVREGRRRELGPRASVRQPPVTSNAGPDTHLTCCPHTRDEHHIPGTNTTNSVILWHLALLEAKVRSLALHLIET